jgi:hypothetical protein
VKSGTYAITIRKGTSFSLQLRWLDNTDAPVNLTGFTARMHVRASKAASSTITTLTTENGRIVLGGAAGTITLQMTAADTTATSLAEGFYFYALELVSPGSLVTSLLEGRVSVEPEVTR